MTARFTPDQFERRAESLEAFASMRAGGEDLAPTPAEQRKLDEARMLRQAAATERAVQGFSTASLRAALSDDVLEKAVQARTRSFINGGGMAGREAMRAVLVAAIRSAVAFALPKDQAER